jgi:hypothetical protein
MGPVGWTDERPGNAQPRRDGWMSEVENFSFFEREKDWSAVQRGRIGSCAPVA